MIAMITPIGPEARAIQARNDSRASTRGPPGRPSTTSPAASSSVAARLESGPEISPSPRPRKANRGRAPPGRGPRPRPPASTRRGRQPSGGNATSCSANLPGPAAPGPGPEPASRHKSRTVFALSAQLSLPPSLSDGRSRDNASWSEAAAGWAGTHRPPGLKAGDPSQRRSRRPPHSQRIPATGFAQPFQILT